MPPLLRSELPIRAQRRHHWITWFRKTTKFWTVVLAIAPVITLIRVSWGTAVVVLVVELVIGTAWRVYTWQAEWIILTGKRILRVQGVPETTSAEASLKLERVSGARLVQSVLGKILGYGDIELEAPGDHPDTHELMKVANVVPFFMVLRESVFGEWEPPEPEEYPQDRDTEPLPAMPAVEQIRDAQRRVRHPHRP